MTMYPSKFYVAHKLFEGAAFPKPVWGDILDGPAEWTHNVTEAVLDTFRDEAPTRDTLRVWMFDGVRAHDMTDSFIAAWQSRQLEAAE